VEEHSLVDTYPRLSTVSPFGTMPLLSRPITRRGMVNVQPSHPMMMPELQLLMIEPNLSGFIPQKYES
jgi:hypothetical protein